MNPAAILDPFIMTMTLGHLYQKPQCLDPLEADPGSGGKKSDHKIVISRPISAINDKCSRMSRTMKVRLFPQSGVMNMREWFLDQTWEEIYKTESCHEKAKLFQSMLLQKVYEIFPEKSRKIQSDNQPWISFKLKRLDRKRKHVYRKERRSVKRRKIDKAFKKKLNRQRLFFTNKKSLG